MTSAEILKPLQDMPLSNNTVKDRVLKLSADVDTKQIVDINASYGFSIAIDESNDVTDVKQLDLLYNRYVNWVGLQEELVNLISLTSQTRGEEICAAVLKYLQAKRINTEKLVFVATDGAPSMRGNQKGFVCLLQKSLNRQLLNFYCIMHQEALCAQSFPTECRNIMESVNEIVNSIKARALNRRHFCTLLD